MTVGEKAIYFSIPLSIVLVPTTINNLNKLHELNERLAAFKNKFTIAEGYPSYLSTKEEPFWLIDKQSYESTLQEYAGDINWLQDFTGVCIAGLFLALIFPLRKVHFSFGSRG